MCRKNRVTFRLKNTTKNSLVTSSKLRKFALPTVVMSGEDIRVLKHISYPKLAGPGRPEVLKFYEEWKEYLTACESGSAQPVRLKACIPRNMLTPICFRLKSLLAAKKPSLAPVDTPSPESSEGSTPATSSSKGIAGDLSPRVTPGNITDDQLMVFIRHCARIGSHDDLGLALRKSLKFPSVGSFEERIFAIAYKMTEVCSKCSCGDITEDNPELAAEHLLRVLEPKFFAKGLRKDIETEHSELLSDFGELMNYIIHVGQTAHFDEWLLDFDKQRSEKSSKEGTHTVATNQAKTTSGRGPVCYVCKGNHRYTECPTLTPEEIREKQEYYRKKAQGAPQNQQQPKHKETKQHGGKGTAPKEFGPSVTRQNTPYRAGINSLRSQPGNLVPCSVQGIRIGLACLDTGANVNAIPQDFVELIEAKSVKIARQKLKAGMRIDFASNKRCEIVSEYVNLDLQLQTESGALTLNQIPCYIVSALDNVIVGTEALSMIGINVKDSLNDACRQSESVHFDGMIQNVSQASISRLNVVDEEYEPDILCMNPVVDNEGVLKKLVEESEFVDKGPVSEALHESKDIWREQLGPDQPAKVPPMNLTLKPDAPNALQCKLRMYNTTHTKFLKEHLNELLENDLIEEYPDAQFVSPVYVVPKKEPNEFRMTVDLRELNKMCEKIAYPLVDIKFVLETLHDAKYFATLDLFKGFWQMPLAQKASELSSFITPFGIFRPKRVLMGSLNSVQYFQRVMTTILKDLLYDNVIIYIDDIFVFADTQQKLLNILKIIFSRCIKYNLKLNAKKSKLCMKQLKFCGRIISADGIRHDPERIASLCAMSPPGTLKQLVQFLAALNWLRESLPNFAQVAGPLYELQRRLQSENSSKSGKQCAKVAISNDDWEPVSESFRQCKELLRQAVLLAFPRKDCNVHLFTDASDEYWSAVVTQSPADQEHLPLYDQLHQPLVFLSGRFSGSQLNWPIIDKECFAIVAAFKKVPYLLQKTVVHTDHKNLTYILSPQEINPNIPLHNAKRVYRWALELNCFDYRIEHIKGEHNILADLLSRPFALGPQPVICALSGIPQATSPQPSTPLSASAIEWPSLAEIKSAQEEEGEDLSSKSGFSRIEYQGLELACMHDKVYVPKSRDLQTRMMVVAHMSTMGHRGIAATLSMLTERFWWPDMRENVRDFINQCIHCMSCNGPARIPRPLGETMHAKRCNEIVHFDYLSMHESYLLVIKDDFSKYVMLRHAKSASASFVVDSLMHWFSLFGYPQVFISDQGSHFKNTVMTELTERYAIAHHFTTPYCPWANGSVERANRDILKVFRVMLSEYRMDVNRWSELISLVQFSLNNLPRRNLAMHAPITVMTGLPKMSPLEDLFKKSEFYGEDTNVVQVRKVIAESLDSIDRIHKRVLEVAPPKQSHHVKEINFHIGDFVLVSFPTRKNKLKCIFRGPYRILTFVSPCIVKVEHLTADLIEEAHVSRVKLYADKSLYVTESLKNQADYSHSKYEVESFLSIRIKEKEFQLLVRWRGFTQEYDTYENLSDLYEDVPQLILKYLSESEHPLARSALEAVGQ